MIFTFFFIFSFSVKHEEVLYAMFVRPYRNPLEMYPFSYLPLCISQPVPGFFSSESYKCQKPIAKIPSNRFIPPQSWCTTELTPDSRSFLSFLLTEQYQIIFKSGNQSTFCQLGSTNGMIYTHFNFVYLKTLEDFTLANVIPSNLINISEHFLGFTYETSFISTPKTPPERPIMFSFIIGAFLVVIILILALTLPNSSKRSYITVSRVPGHSFSLVILCGSGAGILIAIIYFIIMNCSENNKEFEKSDLIIPEIISAFTTSVVTSILCGIWRLHDVASALYFAPLLFPSLSVAILFTVQWISVSVDSCLIVPLNFIFYVIVTIVFIMIPTNLAGSLITAALFKPRVHTSQKLKIAVRRLSRSRRNFITVTNSLMFCLTFPFFQVITDSVEYDRNIPLDTITFNLFLITYLLSGIACGIASIGIKCEKETDWAWFSFISASGGSVAIWIISYFWSALVLKQTSTLQMSYYPMVTLLICIALALISGTISVLTSQICIYFKGVPVKRS